LIFRDLLFFIKQETMTEENITLENYPFTSVMNLEKDEAVYFKFEEDFVEENIRCIPMCVRFKLDACGIKLKLSEWSKMKFEERNLLCRLECNDSVEIRQGNCATIRRDGRGADRAVGAESVGAVVS